MRTVQFGINPHPCAFFLCMVKILTKLCVCAARLSFRCLRMQQVSESLFKQNSGEKSRPLVPLVFLSTDVGECIAHFISFLYNNI